MYIHTYISCIHDIRAPRRDNFRVDFIFACMLYGAKNRTFQLSRTRARTKQNNKTKRKSRAAADRHFGGGEPTPRWNNASISLITQCLRPPYNKSYARLLTRAFRRLVYAIPHLSGRPRQRRWRLRSQVCTLARYMELPRDIL